MFVALLVSVNLYVWASLRAAPFVGPECHFAA